MHGTPVRLSSLLLGIIRNWSTFKRFSSRSSEMGNPKFSGQKSMANGITDSLGRSTMLPTPNGATACDLLIISGRNPGTRPKFCLLAMPPITSRYVSLGPTNCRMHRRSASIAWSRSTYRRTLRPDTADAPCEGSRRSIHWCLTLSLPIR